MNRRALLLAVPVAALVLLAACGSDETTVVAADLDGSTWTAESVDGYELAGTLTIEFADGRLSVTGGCNTLGGDYRLDDGVLSAGPLMSTLRACPDELMDQDQWFTGLLEDGLETSLDGDTLELANDDVTIVLGRVA